MEVNTVHLKFILLLIVLSYPYSSGTRTGFINVYPRLESKTQTQDCGNALFLTPYLKRGAISEAQDLSRVSLTEKIGFRSYAGFLTIDETYNSNLYFWYFPPLSKNASATAPVILWLQGGPGVTSLFGLFFEAGPLIAKKGGVALRKHHWTEDNHVIFVDNPVGTGFSFTENEKGYCNDEDCIGKGLYNSLQQFFTMFPELKNNEFFIAGESYAGKYVPAIGIEIHRQNSKNTGHRINLKGLIMGNAYCDPINQVTYGQHLYQLGLIDNNQLTVFESVQNEAIAKLKNESWAEALVLLDGLMDGSATNFSYFKNFTGFSSAFSILETVDTVEFSLLTDLLEKNNVRRSIHVGGLPFNSGEQALLHLLNDIPQSVAPFVAELLSHYRVIFFSGQLDMLVSYRSTVNFLSNLNFTSLEQYKTAPRNIWRVGDEIAGYYKVAGNLVEMLVRNAGHIAPRDQPRWTLNMLTRFLKNEF